MKNARPVSVLMLVVLALVMAACGSSKSTSSTTSSSTGQNASSTTPAGAIPAAIQERIKKLWAGDTYSQPDMTGTKKPSPGKNVWLITYGNASSAATKAADGFKEATAAAGWQARVFDGKFDSNVQLSGIRQAIANKADGIMLYVIDCPTVQAALKDAKAAGIPVIGIEGFDCNEAKPGAAQLFSSGGMTYNEAPYGSGQIGYPEWIRNFGRAQADSVVAGTGGKAKLIDTRETDSLATSAMSDGFRAEFKTCPGCKILDNIDFTGADFGGNKLQEKMQQALSRRPDANAVNGAYDGPITSGIAAAVRASGRTASLWVVGGEGQPPNIELARAKQGQNSGVVDPMAWLSWAGVETLNRIFHGEANPKVPTGVGLMVWDREHNLPPKNEYVPVPIDYAKAYKDGWAAAK